MKLSLKYKFLIPTVLIFAICMGLTGTVSYLTSKNAMEKIVTEQIVQIAESTVKNFDGWMADRKLDITEWSKQRLFRTAVRNTYMGKNARESACPVLAEFLSSHNSYENICIANAKGEIISSSDSKMIGKYNLADEPFFKEAIAGNISVTEAMKSFSTGNFVFIIASPISENEQQISGVLFGSLTLENFNQLFVRPIRVCETGYAFMFQKTGRFVSHPDTSFIFNKNIKELDFGKLFLTKEKGVVSYVSEGEENIAALGQSDTLNWTLAVSVRRSEILEPADRLSHVFFIFSFVSIVFVTCFVFFMTSLVTKPVRETVKRLKDIAEGRGNLSIRLEFASKDEIGELSEWFNVFVENLRTIILEIARITNKLKKSSRELAALSSEMASSSREMESQTDTIAGSSAHVMSNANDVASSITHANSSVSKISGMTDEIFLMFNKLAEFAWETSENINDMAHSNHDASSDIHDLVSAIEEMTLSLKEVAAHTRQASRISQNADFRTKEIDTKMNGLVTASKQIGKLTGVIKDIADQTNMLALNAAIEAAGAGEAGRGFAVVAAEVKELAKQSADATDIITEHIDQIRSSVREAVATIGDITKIINDIAKINESVATSAEKQTSSANEVSISIASNAEVIKKVAENAGESAQFAKEIAKSTTDTSEIAGDVAMHVNDLVKMITNIVDSSAKSAADAEDIAKNIQMVNSAFKYIASGSAQIRESSKELAHSADSLSKIVQQFQL